MKTCFRCGTILQDSSTFCGICGQIWIEQKPELADEGIVGFVVSTITGEKTLFSGLSNVHCLLIFTTQRLVVMKGSAQTRQNIPNYRRIDPYVFKLLEDRGLNGILASGTGNFSIPYSDMLKVNFGRRWLNSRMNIVTKDDLYQFTWFWPWALSSRVERVIRSRFPVEVPVEKVKHI